ncbi:hypothetical protein T08_6759 [Trichinella sp. T8]|nr:hypothetical protein T08_6759 [Trichinella sp. T8]
MRFLLRKTKRKKTEATERLEVARKCACVFVDISSSVLVSDSLIKCIVVVCCFIVAMPSGKREAERKGNTPVNIGPSPNSDGRANNLVEEADEPARGSGPLQWEPVRNSS